MSKRYNYPDYVCLSNYCKIIERWKGDSADLLVKTLFSRELSLHEPEPPHAQVNLDNVADNKELMALSIYRKNAAATWHKCGYEKFPWPTESSENDEYELLIPIEHTVRPELTKDERDSRKLELNGTIECKQCPEDCYRYFFKQKTIKVRDALNILNGVDPRTKKQLKYHQRYFQAFYQAIKRAATKRQPELKIVNGCNFGINSNLNSNQFFKWAAEKYPEFDKFLPEDMPYVPTQFEFTAQYALGVELTKEEKEMSQFRTEIAKLKAQMAENQPLLEEGKKYIKYRESQREKASKSRRRK